MAATVGILANPLAGKDVRRLTAKAAVTPMDVKRTTVARLLLAADEVGAERILLLPSPFRVSERAVEEVRHRLRAEVGFVDVDCHGGAADTHRAVELMRDEGVSALIAVGGDGTSRDVALVWPEAPLLPLSTGTNNAFPEVREATIVGAAAGLVATGAVPLAGVSTRAKVVHVEVDRPGTGVEQDLALVDAVLLDERIVGWRDLARPQDVRVVVTTRGEPTAVGYSGLAGLLHPTSPADDAGLEVRLRAAGPGSRTLRAPIAPGRYDSFGVVSYRPLALGEKVVAEGPGVLACDGERQRAVPGAVRFRVERDGPFVIDVPATLAAAAHAGHFLGDTP